MYPILVLNTQSSSFSQSFAEYSYVRKHIRAFHGERKFGCQYCAKSFTSADKLRIHEVMYVQFAMSL